MSEDNFESEIQRLKNLLKLVPVGLSMVLFSWVLAVTVASSFPLGKDWQGLVATIVFAILVFPLYRLFVWLLKLVVGE